MVTGWDKGMFREESVVVQYVQTWACIPSMLVSSEDFEKV